MTNVEIVGPINIPFEKLETLNKTTARNWQRIKPDQGGGVAGSLEGSY
jgi:hypothetical protein